MKRRRLLLDALTLVSLSLFPKWLVTRAATRPRKAADLNVDRLFSDLAGAKRLGRRYLRAYPATTLDSLHRQLIGPMLENLDLKDTESVRQYLAVRREMDFAAGLVVVVDGWVLADTEAQLSALAALT
jgi:hypothetical protein